MYDKLVTVVLFFVYSWGLGYAVTRFAKPSKDFFERNIMRIGLGLGVLPILGVLLNLLHIAIDWRIIFFLSLAVPAYDFVRGSEPEGKDKKKKAGFLKNLRISPRIRLTKPSLYIALVALMFAFTFFMYLNGSFAAPWLENGDPWEYATTAKHIAMYRTFSKPADIYAAHYMEPYPMGYNIIMGVLHQTTQSINWTLKFFNSLLISLSLVFFYFFVRRFTRNKEKALIATFILTIIPCYKSHFIFSEVLAQMLFFPALYAIERLSEDKAWAFAAAFPIGAILITQWSTAGLFAFVFMPIYFLGRAIMNRDLQKWLLVAGLIGSLLALAYWGPMIAKYGWEGGVKPYGSSFADGSSEKFYKTGTEVYYSLADFVQAPIVNKIDNPTGLGPILFFLTVVSVVLIFLRYKTLFKSPWLVISLLWLLANAANVNGDRLPIAFNPHRGWSFLAIAVAIVAAQGMYMILTSRVVTKENAALVVALILVVALAYSSGYPKYRINTVPWPTHYFTSVEEVQGYMWLVNLPKNSRVTSLCKDDHKVIGMDMVSTAQWDPQMLEFKKQFMNYTGEQIYSVLKGKGYEYTIFDGSCTTSFGVDEANKKLDEIGQTRMFSLVHSTAGMVLLKVL